MPENISASGRMQQLDAKSAASRPVAPDAEAPDVDSEERGCSFVWVVIEGLLDGSVRLSRSLVGARLDQGGVKTSGVDRRHHLLWSHPLGQVADLDELVVVGHLGSDDALEPDQLLAHGQGTGSSCHALDV